MLEQKLGTGLHTDSSGEGKDVSQEASDDAGDVGDINDFLALGNRSGESTEEKSWQSQSGGELHLAGGLVGFGFKRV